MMKNECRDLNVYVWGANTPSANDDVSINYGDKPFKYNISGFTPWSKKQKQFTCYYKRKQVCGTVFILNLMVVEMK